MKRTLSICLLTAALPLIAAAAYAPGGFAFTKRVDTALLAEPAPLAPAAVRLKLGTKVKIEEVKGPWLRVSEGTSNAGWIFSGNVSASAPDKEAGLAAIPFDASATTATAAARPLKPAATEYSERKDMTKAKEDLDWVMSQAAKVTTAEITAHLQETQKGEYQPAPAAETPAAETPAGETPPPPEPAAEKEEKK